MRITRTANIIISFHTQAGSIPFNSQMNTCRRVKAHAVKTRHKYLMQIET